MRRIPAWGHGARMLSAEVGPPVFLAASTTLGDDSVLFPHGLLKLPQVLEEVHERDGDDDSSDELEARLSESDGVHLKASGCSGKEQECEEEQGCGYVLQDVQFAISVFVLHGYSFFVSY